MDSGHRFRDWSGMPNELLQDIFLKIDCLDDAIHFSFVCKEWLSVFRQVGPNLSSANPWLLFPENTEDNPEGMRKVYNPGNKYYNLRVPEIFGKKCWGSSLGWIVTYDGELEISLFNPLTKSRLQLPPSNTMMPEQAYVDPSCDSKYNNRNLTRARHILKACVLKTKGGTEDAGGFLVAVIHAQKCRRRKHTTVDSTYLSIARPGDKTWTLIPTPEEMIVRDVLIWKEMLWFVTKDCSMWYADLSETGPSLKAVKLILDPHRRFHICPKTYLVESSNHELLLVERFSSRNNLMISKSAFYPVSDEQSSDKKSPREYTHTFRIFKLDLSSKKWEHVDNASVLGESSMYMDKNTSLLVGPSKHGICKSKCIYFLDDHTAKSGGATGDTLLFTPLLC
ncbi:putative F-box protein At4g17565 [Silene latifolia]|uniref:putative F-box protein At4g17565 n=1 Tax=Silene latifolia TaxID=37657 RepID=UPI003D774C3B